MESRLGNFRKYSSFPSNPAADELNLASTPTNVDPEIILKGKHYWAKHAKKGRSNIHQKVASPFPLPFYETNQNKWGE